MKVLQNLGTLGSNAGNLYVVVFQIEENFITKKENLIKIRGQEREYKNKGR